MKTLALLIGLLGFCATPGMAQNKKAMTVEDVLNFQRITYKALSNDGKWVIAVTEPWRGDGDRNGSVPPFAGDATAKIYSTNGSMIKSFSPISKISFSNNSKYVVLSTKLPEAEREAKALKEQNKKDKKGGKKEKDLEKLHIYAINGNTEIVDSLRSYKMAKKADWLAYQTGQKDSTLHVRILGGKEEKFNAVTDFFFPEEGNTLCFVTKGSGIDGKCGLFGYTKGDATPILLKEGKGEFKQITFNDNGTKIAFLYADSKEETSKGMQLWTAEIKSPAQKLLDKTESFSPKGWIISENGRLSFSKDSKRLFFGTAPKPQEKDSTMLASKRPEVQVWSWNEPVQYTVQTFNKDRESKRTYQAVIDLTSNNAYQLANKELPDFQTNATRNGEWGLLSTTVPYSNSSMWEGRSKHDYYAVNLNNGQKKPLRTADYTSYRLSPEGRYAYGYAETDSVWRTIDLSTGKVYTITTPHTFKAWDNDNDVPDYPNAYGAAGWLANEEGLLIYDRFNIWKVPAQGGTMTNLTKDGEQKNVQYRLVRLEPTRKIQEEGIDLKKTLLLTAFNETTKGYAYYQLDCKKNNALPTLLMGGNYMLSRPTKAEEADKILFSKETFEQFPDLFVSDLRMKSPIAITHEISQQDKFVWGTAELISWTSYKGVKLEGVIYKPANFDPSKKYPLIVNFYERNAETLYSYRVPQPHRSTPDYHMYNSNGYVVFNPDVRYIDGHPGESCYDCVMSGIDKVLEGGYIDEKRIGAAGHSWGGYQTAYLATRTNRFAAFESGAPVVNMFSAYGGIRWGSGLARAFQYEHTQSRIGASPWESPELYKENSSLFNMDKVNTPILIMHNDADGHVPWYQGIEFFVALKRLGKPSWMLNYPGEPHWPVKMANRADFQKRMLQFFNHYLKGEEMPKWMKEGVKAVDQPFELGY